VIQGPNQGYVGEPIFFDASASVAGSSPIVSYSWNFGDGTSAGPSANPSQTTIYNQSGNFQVSVVVTDESGQSSSATMGVTISTRLNTPVVWALDSYANLEVLPGTAITLQFQAGQIAGFSGCNSYTGSYTATDNGDGTYTVTVTGLVGTGMMCPADIMDQEQTYLGILSSVTLAQSQGNVLTLSSPQSSLVYHQTGD
jgi:heat shock protein HslJ